MAPPAMTKSHLNLSSEVIVIKISNWSSYQSYKDRKPPWIRFHKSMLDNYEFHMMSVNSRAILPMLWLLASEDDDPTSGLIKDSYKKIAFRLRCNEKEIVRATQECAENGFIQVIENQACIESVHDPLRNRISTVTPETEAETYREETETELMFKFEEFWNLYGIKKGRAKCEVSFKRLLKKGTKFSVLMKGLEGYQSECRKKDIATEFIKNPLTWLNGKHWNDEYERELTREERIEEIRRNIEEPTQLGEEPCKSLN